MTSSWPIPLSLNANHFEGELLIIDGLTMTSSWQIVITFNILAWNLDYLVFNMSLLRLTKTTNILHCQNRQTNMKLVSLKLYSGEVAFMEVCTIKEMDPAYG